MRAIATPRVTRAAALLPLCALFGTGVLATGALSHPLVDEITKRCTPIVTAQKGMCEVELFYRCDDQGYAIVSAEAGELVGVEFSDLTGDLGDFVSLAGPGSVTVETTVDPLDLNLLRETGSETARTESTLDLGEEVAITLSLRLELSDRRVTRNGITFRTGSAGMDMTTEASIGGFSRVWELLLPEGENFVILGRSTMVTDRDTREFDTDVREILVPGDPGFQSRQGRFDCGEEL